METSGPSAPSHSERPVWLSGELLTLLNKLVFPTVCLAVLAGLVLAVVVSTNQIWVGGGFGLVVVVVLLVTGLMMWMSFYLERVGYTGGELIVANYWREARVPFEEIEAVEPIWWYRPRMVRIRFSKQTPFGTVVYYLPKWTFANSSATTPEQELRDLLMQAGVPT